MNYLKLWHEFSNVSVNDADEIEESFIHFEIGTYKFDIWTWFDKKLPKGIAHEQFNKV